MPACCAGQPTGVENRGDAPRLPVFLTGAMPALGLLALPTLWASSSIRGVDHPSVARLVKDWATQHPVGLINAGLPVVATAGMLSMPSAMDVLLLSHSASN